MTIKSISYYDVVKAINKVIKLNKKPSINKIRQLIVGGNNEIDSELSSSWDSRSSTRSSSRRSSRAIRIGQPTSAPM